MTSQAAEITYICPVCFETRPLKIAGRCKHSICTECLTIAIGRQDRDMFSCPTCQADCPRPLDGVEGLVDFTGEEVTVEELGILIEQGRMLEEENDVVVNTVMPRERRGSIGRLAQNKDLQKTLVVRCVSCHHKKKEAQAVNLCVECNNLHICQDCTEIHARNKATQGHVVIRLQPERKEEEAICETHCSPINRYCHVCKQAVCVVCILFEHGDHTIEKLGDIVETKGKALKLILKDREKELEKLQELEEELTFCARIVPMIDKQDVLIKEIEGYAQNCIDKILKWKEDLKAQVGADYKVVHDIPECLRKISEMIRNLNEPIDRAQRLLVEMQHQPVYLERLIALQEDFEALAETGSNVEGEGYMGLLQELHNSDCRFTPVAFDSIGKIAKSQAMIGKFKPTELFELKVPVVSKNKFIPCVAIFGQKVAVAQPTRRGEPSHSVSIYKFFEKSKKTFKDHVHPLYDMSATPDGKLAVLSDGTGGTSRCVKLFDLETGYIKSTQDFGIAKPLSLGVTLRHQYVILGDNEEGERQITVVDEDGHVEHTHVIKEEFRGAVIKPKRITCGGKFIFLMGKIGLFIYEIKHTGIHYDMRMWSSFIEPAHNEHVDISADVWDSVLFTCIHDNSLTLRKFVTDKESKFTWSEEGYITLLNEVTGAHRETRVSTRDSHIVVYNGDTVKVYKE